MKFSRLIKKYFKSTEELVSMFLGLVIVVVVVGLIYNYIQKGKGNTAVPGISDISISEEDFITKDGTVIDGKDVYVVEKNDSLWKIAVRTYGDGYQWTKIWQENKSKLNNPNNLEIGMILNLPSLK